MAFRTHKDTPEPIGEVSCDSCRHYKPFKLLGRNETPSGTCHSDMRLLRDDWWNLGDPVHGPFDQHDCPLWCDARPPVENPKRKRKV